MVRYGVMGCVVQLALCFGVIWNGVVWCMKCFGLVCEWYGVVLCRVVLNAGVIICSVVWCDVVSSVV